MLKKMLSSLLSQGLKGLSLKEAFVLFNVVVGQIFGSISKRTFFFKKQCIIRLMFEQAVRSWEKY